MGWKIHLQINKNDEIFWHELIFTIGNLQNVYVKNEEKKKKKDPIYDTND